MRSEPRIVCAANRNSQTGEIAIGVRHYCPIMRKHIQMMGDEKSTGWRTSDQGFIDQFGSFYNREEAWVIAERNGQIFRRCGGDDGRLFSENLY